jgi:hypothetical protein
LQRLLIFKHPALQLEELPVPRIGRHKSHHHLWYEIVVAFMAPADNMSPPGAAKYDSSTMSVGDGTWDFVKNTFLLPNLVGLNFDTMQYNGKSRCWPCCFHTKADPGLQEWRTGFRHGRNITL